MHVSLDGWVGPLLHHANLLEQTKRSVVVVTNKRWCALGWVGGSVLFVSTACGILRPSFEGWAIIAAWPQACPVSRDVLGQNQKY